MDEAMRDMDAAIHEASECRRKASEMKQSGFTAYAEFLFENAKSAEKWLLKAGQAYPSRCGASGKKVT